MLIRWPGVRSASLCLVVLLALLVAACAPSGGSFASESDLDGIDSVTYRGFYVEGKALTFDESDSSTGALTPSQELAGCFVSRMKEDDGIMRRDVLVGQTPQMRAAAQLLLGDFRDSVAALEIERIRIEESTGASREDLVSAAVEQGFDRGDSERYLDALDAVVADGGGVDDRYVLLVLSAATTVRMYVFLDTAAPELLVAPKSESNSDFGMYLYPENELVKFDTQRCDTFES